jgi:hypothetical protein
MAGHELCRVTLVAANGAVVAAWLITGEGAPTLALVDRLAGLRLAAARNDWELRIGAVCTDLEALLELVGLREILRPEAAAEVRTSGRSGPCRGRS